VLAGCVALAGCTSLSPASDDINGASNPCFAATETYRYCKTDNFPYHWNWSVLGDATVTDDGTEGNCYRAKLTVRHSPVTLTFRQINPVNLPQLPDVSKYIAPRRCEP
jgi:hypothetical protein